MTWEITGRLTPLQWAAFDAEADKMSEKTYQRIVLDQARFFGWQAHHATETRRQVSPGVFVGDADFAGFPDTVLAHPGVGVVFAEIKRQKGYSWQPGQREYLDFLTTVPGPYVAMWQPRDHRGVEQLLADLDVTAPRWWSPSGT